MSRSGLVVFFLCFALLTAFADGIEFGKSLDEAAKKAKEGNKLLFVYFTGPNCPACDLLKEETFSKESVQKFVKEGFVPVKVYYGEGDSKELFKKYEIRGIPQVIIMDAEKKEVVRIIGFKVAREFLKAIKDGMDAVAEKAEAEEALKKDENDIKAHYKLAEALRKQNKVDEAREHYGKVIELDKENKNGLKAKALFRLGEAELFSSRDYLGNLKKANEKFEEVESLDGEKKGGFADRIEYYRLEGRIWENLRKAKGDAETARRLATDSESFIKKFPESEFIPFALYFASLFYHYAKDYEKALEKVNKLLDDYGDTQMGFTARRWKVKETIEKELEKEKAEKEEEKK